MCRDSNDFIEIDECNVGRLNLTSSASTDIKARGRVSFTSDHSGRMTNVDLANTLHVPYLRSNLLSVGRITDNGYKVIFAKDSAAILNKKGHIKLKAKRCGLYYICENLANESDIDLLTTWHNRLGHLNVRDLVEVSHKGAILGLELPKKMPQFECETCIRGKMSRTPFPKKSIRKTESLELIHTDVCGPMRVESNGKALYFITFIDDNSRWCEVRFLRKKSDVLSEFRKMRALMERQKGAKIKCIQSDNGTEYLNNLFDEYLENDGIRRRLTVANNPEQNRIAERKNRTLLETARCLLLQSGLPPSFCAEAIATANYLRNRCPTKPLDGKPQ